MPSRAHLFFAPFHLDLVNEQLWHESQQLALRPKLFTLLRYLVAHAGQLVTKEELLQAGWPDTHGSQGLLKGCMRELRRALGDDADVPRFIETVGRRGYRFMAPVTTAPATAALPVHPARHTMVGRETELAQLHGWLHQALAGARQVVFVTGEPGMGKTTVVDTFLAQIEAGGLPAMPAASGSEIWIAQGRCVEHYGAGEAYLPVLEALGRLCRDAGGERLIALLGHHAPTWLAQMPALVSDAELEGLQRRVQDTTRERMLRELAEALEGLTVDTPLILVLEDLQWSDVSTIDLLAALAQRRGRLLLIGTYRPAEVIVSGHPLRGLTQELHGHRQCAEVALRLLTSAEVSQYLQVRFPRHLFPPALARVIHQRTDGNPLFMVNVVDDLVTQQVLSAEDGQWQVVGGLEESPGEAPESLRQLIDKHFDRLTTEEQQVLEAASVAGAEFSAAAVAAAVEATEGAVEECCARLARRKQFLRARGGVEWPDGTVAEHYAFLHALYQQVLYERSAAGRRIELHRRIGARKEAAYGERTGEIAAELAVHFEQGQESHKAIHYLQHAGENAVRRHAYSEAIAHFSKGLTLLHTLPETPQRHQQELTLCLTMVTPLWMLKGLNAPEVDHLSTRAYALARQWGDSRQQLVAVWGLGSVYLGQGKLAAWRELVAALLALVQQEHDLILLPVAHFMMGIVCFHCGEFPAVRQHLAQGRTLYDAQQSGVFTSVLSADLAVMCHAREAWAVWMLGNADQAVALSQQALALGQALGHPPSLAYAWLFAALLQQCRRDVRRVLAYADTLLALAREYGLSYFYSEGEWLCAWALVQQARGEHGLLQLQQAIHARVCTEGAIGQPYILAHLAEACGQAGQPAEGLRVVAQALALVETHGKWWYAAELYRQQGELVVQQAQPGSTLMVTAAYEMAEEHFQQARTLAQQQQARFLELRAMMSLSRLWQQQGKGRAAYDLLAPIYGWFTEGFDTADLQAAKALLKELGGRKQECITLSSV
jgi:DNA-binding winged helix-turn-helix (wHTH) protein/tetratricopeptide (TPR) repeat protein